MTIQAKIFLKCQSSQQTSEYSEINDCFYRGSNCSLIQYIREEVKRKTEIHLDSQVSAISITTNNNSATGKTFLFIKTINNAENKTVVGTKPTV